MAQPPDSKLETFKRAALLIAVVVIGVACAVPFGFSIYRLLMPCCFNWASVGVYELGLRAALALMFAGIVLCILLLFYRLRNDDTSPSLTSGLVLTALGAALAALVLFAARGQ